MNNHLRILVVEDNPGDAALLENMLNEAAVSFELKCVERLSSGIEQIKTNSYDVILLDLGLPDSFGLETLIKFNAIQPAAPIIVLTGLADEAVGTEAVKAGAQDYLIKGQIDKNLLSRSINHAIERKRSAEAIQIAASEWSASFDAMVDGVSIHSVDHTILNANQSLFQILGKISVEVIGKKCYQIFHEKECPLADCPLNHTVATNQRTYAEIFEPTLDKWLAVSTAPIMDGSGCLTRIVHTIRDITEQRKLEEQLRHSQKMESVGTLAGGVAHDFNNILTAIIGYGSLTHMKMAADDPLRHNIESMLEAADRAAQLTKELLLFSRKHAIDKKSVDLNAVVARVEKFLIKVIGEDIEYKTVLKEAPLTVLADQYQLEQVLMNLVTNARDSMPQGGILTVTTATVSLDREFITSHGYGKPGAYAQIAVTDTGTGMNGATQLRIFEPFFTTKEVGKGTGLGLAVTYGIVKQHDGYITVYSEPGSGTTFRIYLPIISAEEQETSLAELAEVAIGGTETILLAEDDKAVRELTNSVLAEHGYTVIMALDGVDAVTKFEENSQAIDLLLLDINMPRMNGKDAFDVIQKIRPGIKAIFSSGYASETIRQKVSLADSIRLISKPISPKELLKEVRKMLDNGK